MKSQLTKISEIKLNPNNPRLIKDDKFKKLVQSIKDFPEMLDIRPIVVNTDMVILGGNMRFKACKDAGLKEVPIVIADNLSEEQQREFLIKDNVSGGEWDFEMLANEWDTEQLEEWGLDIPTFDINGEPGDEGNFDDPGISDKNQYGVIVVCESAGTQESVFNDLTKMGFNCKIVVT
jgi:ParB-like chromosome segregation protein Spo0J